MTEKECLEQIKKVKVKPIKETGYIPDDIKKDFFKRSVNGKDEKR